MKNDLTELVFILDRSGSMHGMEKDTVGGFNAMLEKQKKLPGRALVSTVLFDQDRLVVHDRQPLDTVQPMTEADYQVGGCTALLDAVGCGIHHIGTAHRYARPEDVPEKTVFVIITDGMENASTLYSYHKVRKLLLQKQEESGWEFLFLGANMDAAAEAARFGVRADRAVRYRADCAGTALNYQAVGEAVTRIRGRETLSGSWKADIEADTRRRGR